MGEGCDHTSMSVTELAEFVQAHAWTYAKTMPQCPHEYVVRKNVADDACVVLPSTATTRTSPGLANFSAA